MSRASRDLSTFVGAIAQAIAEPAPTVHTCKTCGDAYRSGQEHVCRRKREEKK